MPDQAHGYFPVGPLQADVVTVKGDEQGRDDVHRNEDAERECVWNVDDQRLDADQAPDEYQDCEGVWGRIRMSKL